jgi:hypothetical protein
MVNKCRKLEVVISPINYQQVKALQTQLTPTLFSSTTFPAAYCRQKKKRKEKVEHTNSVSNNTYLKSFNIFMEMIKYMINTH